MCIENIDNRVECFLMSSSLASLLCADNTFLCSLLSPDMTLVLPSELGTAVGVTLIFNSMKVFTENLGVETSIP